MYKRRLIAILALLGLSVLFTGCGEDAEEEQSTSISIPLNLSPAMPQGEYTVEITISGPDMTTRIIKQTLDIQIGTAKTHEIIVSNIPVGDNRNIKVVISKDGVVWFEGSETVDLFVGAGNYASITVDYLPPEVDNLITNGGFERGILVPWFTYGDIPSVIIIQGDAIEGKYCLRIGTKKGGTDYSLGLKYPYGIFKKGKVYTLSAFLKSPDRLKIALKLELDEDPWTGYANEEFTMADKWEEYHISTKIMPRDVKPAAITFHIAYDTGQFYVDDVKLYEGEYIPSKEAVAQ